MSQTVCFQRTDCGYINDTLNLPSLELVTTTCSRDLLKKLTVPQLVKKSPVFYGNRSPPYSQQTATCPYREPDQSSPHPPISFKIHSYIILLSRPRSPFRVSPPKPCMHLSCLPYVLHADYLCPLKHTVIQRTKIV